MPLDIATAYRTPQIFTPARRPASMWATESRMKRQSPHARAEALEAWVDNIGLRLGGKAVPPKRGIGKFSQHGGLSLAHPELVTLILRPRTPANHLTLALN